MLGASGTIATACRRRRLIEIARGRGQLGQADEAIGEALQALLGRGVVRGELQDLAVLLQRVAAGRGRQPQGREVGLCLCQEGGDVILLRRSGQVLR